VEPLSAAEALSAMTPVPLPPILDQRTCEPVRDAILAGLSAGAPIALDGSAVERVGTIGIQFLLSAAKSAEQTGADFAIAGPSPALRQTISALGLEGCFSPWIRP
jgi:chemotaxis protein CheX